jgi:hypothetical protein
MAMLGKIRAAILIGEARRLSSISQSGRAFEKIVAAYAQFGEQPPSAKLPFEVNLSLAAMAANANRYSLVSDALSMAETQLPSDRSLSASDRSYVAAYMRALRLLCEGVSWREARADREVIAGANTAGVKRHLRANFPFV